MVSLRKYIKSSDNLNEINRFLNEENANRYEVLQSILNEYMIFDDLYLSQGACFWYIKSFSNDKIVGTIGVKKVSYETAEIKRYYVNVKYRRKNLGKTLFYKALDFALKNEYKKIIVKVSKDNDFLENFLISIKFKKIDVSHCEHNIWELLSDEIKTESIQIINSLNLQKIEFDNSIILNPVENVLFGDTLFPISSFLHGLYSSDSIRDTELKRSTKIQFGSRGKIANDLNIIYRLWSELLGAEEVTMRLLSGLHAHTILFMSITKPGDKVMLLSELAGGHFSTPKILERLGLEIQEFSINEKEHRIDKGKSLDLISKFKPDFIFIDRSEGLIYENFGWLKEVENVYKIFDASQYLTNIISKDYQNPFDMGFDMIISTLHKNFPGPQQALICTNKADQHWTKLKSYLSVFVSNMHSYNIYAAGLALNHLEELNKISKEMIKCTKVLDALLNEQGVTTIQRKDTLYEPATHHIWIKAQDQTDIFNVFCRLEEYGINVNYRLLPYSIGYGLRLGLSGAVCTGLKSKDCDKLSLYISKIYKNEFVEKEEISKFLSGLRGEH